MKSVEELLSEVQEQRKLAAAKRAWPKRDKLTSKKITWAQWFEERYGESLEAYRARVSENA